MFQNTINRNTEVHAIHLFGDDFSELAVYKPEQASR